MTRNWPSSICWRDSNRKSCNRGWRANPHRSVGCLPRSESAPRRIKGLYIHGDVGRGKTMLMDLFFAGESGRAQAPRAFS